MNTPQKVFLSLGANKGDRLSYVYKAIRLLTDLSVFRFQILRTINNLSSIYSSPPILPEGSSTSPHADYLNIVIEGETNLSPEDLLHFTQQIEKRLGRNEKGNYAPREIDIDILSYNRLEMTTSTLILPHPHIEERFFVLTPLCEIAPEWQMMCKKHNNYVSARELLTILVEKEINHCKLFIDATILRKHFL